MSLSVTPEILLPPVWPTPLSLATTSGISVDVFSSPYLDVSVQAVPFIWLCIHHMILEYCSSGFPHSEICGSKDICSSPQLIAAYHVFRRLPVPRHSPCALFRLTVFQPTYISVNCFFDSPNSLPTRYNQNCRLIIIFSCISLSQLLFSFQGAS